MLKLMDRCSVTVGPAKAQKQKLKTTNVIRTRTSEHEWRPKRKRGGKMGTFGSTPFNHQRIIGTTKRIPWSHKCNRVINHHHYNNFEFTKKSTITVWKIHSAWIEICLETLTSKGSQEDQIKQSRLYITDQFKPKKVIRHLHR